MKLFLFCVFIIVCFSTLSGSDTQESNATINNIEESSITEYFNNLTKSRYSTSFSKSRHSISVSGSIAEDEFWSADTVNVVGDIVIEDGICLTIEPGTMIDFQGFFAFDVQGRLLAEGTTVDSIYFTKSDTTGFSYSDSLNGAWKGINFVNTSAENDSSKISFCKIEFGKANLETTTESMGGGIYISGFSKIDISNCTISNNYAVNGGGIVFQNCSPRISNCIIKDCEAENSTGGLGCYFGANPIIDNCRINNNSAFWGGGLECYSNSNPILSNLEIYNNTAGEHGGGLLCAHNSAPFVINCKIYENTALYGVGIDCFIDCSPTIFNTLIYHNQANSAGGAMSVSYNSNPKLINVTVVENYSEHEVGGIHIGDAHPVIINSIFWNNQDYDVYLLSFQEYDNEVTIRNSLIDGGLEGIGNYDINEVYWQEGNLDLDPVFANDLINPFQLSQNSPCIDAGTENVHDIIFPEIDLIGNDRIIGSTIDIGCYEFQEIGADDPIQDSSDFRLTNHPNPFNPTTTIFFETTNEHEETRIEIYNIKGQKIETIPIYPSTNSPINSITWNAERFSSGVYFYKLNVSGKTVETKKCLLLK
jgi:hypothetical protein